MTTTASKSIQSAVVEGSVRSKDGTPIGFFQVGSGPALVFVNGSISDHRDWKKVARNLCPHFTCILMDRRGRGHSRNITSEYTIRTTAIGGQPLPAQVEVTLLAADGRRLKSYREMADEQGQLQVSVPADLKLPDRTRFQVVAWHGKSQAGAETTLTVEPRRYASRMALWSH